MKTAVLILAFCCFWKSEGYVMNGEDTLSLQSGEFKGEMLTLASNHRKFIWKFGHIPYGQDLYLDVYISGQTNSNNLPIILTAGNAEIPKVCDSSFCSAAVIVNLSIEAADEAPIKVATAKTNVKKIQSAVAWIHHNAKHLGGDLKRITLVGLGKSGSLAVSMVSAKKDTERLFQRIIIEFGESSFFSDYDLLQHMLESLERSLVPAQRKFLIGYDSRTTDSQHVTTIVNFIEAYANTGSRVTLFNRQYDSVTATGSHQGLFRLFVQFATENTYFPQMNLGNWRDGVEVVDVDEYGWSTSHKVNLFDPSATADEVDSFPIHSTTLGEIKGRHLIRGEYAADVFYHIPYASKTNRFEYSEMVEPWDNLLDARYPVRYKDCPQHIIMQFGHEDCQNLIVYVPQTINETLDGGPLPVMVFMHGGSYAVGTAVGFSFPDPVDYALYEGTMLADMGKVIVVSVNYRLAALGFLNDGDTTNGVLDGNYGIRDVVLALQWVKNYISEFGGDPDLVTLFGESAGSAGTGLLGLSPMTKGLMKRHIQESGSPLSFFAVDFDPAKIATEIFTELGCRSENLTATSDCLMQRDEFDFVGLRSPHPYVPWRPTIDGVFLTEDPAVTVTNPPDLDLIVGHNYDELYIIAGFAVPKLFTNLPLTVEDVNKVKKALDIVLLEDPDKQQYLSNVVLHAAVGWQMDLTTEQAKIAIVRTSSDYVFAAPSVRQALLRSQNPVSSTYQYSFEITSKVPFFADWSTISHGFELPYVFGLGLRRTERDPGYNATMDKTSLQMMSYWTNFAKTGDPNQPFTDYIDGNIWEPYTPDTKNYMRLTYKMSPENLQSDYRSYEIQLWNDLVPLLLQQDRDACTTKKRKAATSNKKRRMNRKALMPLTTKSMRLFNATCDLAEDYVRNTTTGCVRGVSGDYDGAEVEMYLGIPYAEPPIGNLRFSTTERASSWDDDVLEADDFMSDCPRNATLEGQSEDCLYLNIYRPKTEEVLPVMVWVHSDASTGSGGAMYNGTRIAAFGNVVLVTFNYRIGPFGFLSAGGDTDAAGNYALHDQNMALLWVNENIKNFGGNVSKITIFGDREGSKFAGYHAVTTVNSNQVLFSNVIHQSGVGQMDENLPIDDLESAKTLAIDVGCEVGTVPNMLACLRSKTTEEIMDFADVYIPQVVVDGAFLRDQPKALFERSAQRVNYLIGFTTGEGSSDYDSIVNNVYDRVSFNEFFRNNIAPDFVNPERVWAVLEYEYMNFDSESLNETQNFQKAAIEMGGDKETVAPSILLAANSSITSRFRTRTYVCKLTSPPDDEYPAWIGAPSGSFEKLFWKNFETSEKSPESALSDRIVKYWTSFAKNGRPFGMDPDDSWMRYKAVNGQYGELDAGSEFSLVRQFPRPKYATLWNALIPSIDIEFPCDSPKLPEAPEVVVNGTRIRGYAETTSDGRNYDVFRGLPYAKPPLGEKRFAESEVDLTIPDPDNDSIFPATIKKPKCLQTVNGARGGFASEDCLYLDIWRPNSGVNSTVDSKPVLLWICNGGHGVGGPHSQLQDDTSCDIEGQLMALDGDIIVVKVQYRSGVLGFLSTGNTTIEGNAGLSDLKNALQWVFIHINSFGGNNVKVTVAGNGFGGTLAMIMGSKTVPGGSAQSVIAQSGSLMSPWAYSISPLDDFNDLAIRSGCSSPTHEATAACLRNVNVLELITNAGSLTSTFPFGIYADDSHVPDQLLTTESYMRLYVDGFSLLSINAILNAKPILVGLNGGAGYKFTIEAYPEIRLINGRRPIRPELINKVIDDDIYMGNLGLARGNESAILKDYYTPWGETDNGDEIRRAAVDYHTDEGFLIPTYHDIEWRLSDEHAQSEDTFFYVYEEKIMQRRARWQTSGADLGEEIPILFQEDDIDDDQAALGSLMRHYWATFVKKGSPNEVNSELDRWTRYTSNNKNTMIFESSSTRLVSGYRDQTNKIWKEVFATHDADDDVVVCSTPASPVPPTCPTVIQPTCPDKQPVTCYEPKLGTGIGLELSPTQADAAINALFGISLGLLCIIVSATIVSVYRCKRGKKSCDDISDIVIANEKPTKDEDKESNVSSSL